MKKLPLKDKIFWKNFISFLFLFLVTSAIFGYMPDPDGPLVKYSFLNGYLITSFFAVMWLGVKIAIDFVRSEEIEEYISKNKISREEFHKKYKEILDIFLR